MSINSLVRLGTSNMYANAVNNIGTLQQAMTNTQQSITSGSSINQPSDNPIGAAQAERDMTRIARIQSDQQALSVQTGNVTQAESTLSNAVAAMQSFRQLVVSAGNPTLTASDRQTIAQQLTQLSSQMLSLANTTDANGNPLFGGLGSALTPFAQQGGSSTYTFNGIAGQSTGSATSVPSVLNGGQAFMFQPTVDGSYDASYSTNAGLSSTSPVTLQPPPAAVPTPNSNYQIQFSTAPVTGALQYTVTQNLPPPAAPVVGATTAFTSGTPINFDGLSLTVTGTPLGGDTINVQPNTSIFSVMANAISAIGGAATSTDASQAVGQALSGIDNGINHLQAVQGLAGALMNTSTTLNASETASSTQAQADQSSVAGVNMVQAISNFQNQQTAYTAALKSYAQIQQLSLFNYFP